MHNFFREPKIVLFITLTVSVLILLINSIHLALIVFLSSLLLSILINWRLTLSLTKSILPIIAIYTALAWTVQFIALKRINLEVGLVNFFKFSSIALISISMFSSINIPKLIELFNRFSPKLSFALVLSIKMVKNFSKTWTDVYNLYKVNIGVNSYIDKVRIYMNSVKVFTFLALYVTTQSAEALLTRSKVFRESS